MDIITSQNVLQRRYTYYATSAGFDSPYRFNDTGVRSIASNERCARSAELDQETGLHYYGARYYTNKIGVWLSVDRLAEKYPHSTPYSFSGNNPILYTDPDGNEIVIEGADGSSIVYTPGMTYDGEDEIIKTRVNDLNAIHQSRLGNPVVSDLVSSEATYTIVNSLPDDAVQSVGNEDVEAVGGVFKANENGTGGTIHMNGNRSAGVLGHEAFHAYQHEHGRGGASIQNELEAYLFAFGLNIELNEIAGGPEFTGVSRWPQVNHKFEEHAGNLRWNSEFSEADFYWARDLFRTASGARSLYLRHPLVLPNQMGEPLIKRFYPLVP